MKDAVSRKIEAHKAMCQNSTEVNKRRYKSLLNEARKAVSKAMKEKDCRGANECQNCKYGMVRLVKGLKSCCKEFEGGMCMRGRDGKLSFSEKGYR